MCCLRGNGPAQAQGDVLADYFVLRFLGSAASMRQPAYASQLALYEHVLAGFLANPESRKIAQEHS